MKLICVIASLLVWVFSHAQGIEITGGDEGVFAPAGQIKAGTFGDTFFAITIFEAKNGSFTVAGHRTQDGVKRQIIGNMTKAGVLRARMRMGNEGAREAPVDGHYASDNDTIVITAIDGNKVSITLPRTGKRVIKTGPYHGWSDGGRQAWEATVTLSSNMQDFNVVGTLSVPGKSFEFSGTLKGATGKFTGRAKLPTIDYLVDGDYNFDDQVLNLSCKVQGVFDSFPLVLKPGKLPDRGDFGLVSKVLGTVPGPSEHNNVKVSGNQQENSFRLDMEMTPPYEGSAHIKFEYLTGNLLSTLRPGDEVELTTIATADKSGRDAPNLAGSGFWLVEGDGAQAISVTKAFVGTAGDGKFYASTTGVTKFKVLNGGTIKITAVYTGQYWGPPGSYNWNPVTYTFKFKEPASAKIGK